MAWPITRLFLVPWTSIFGPVFTSFVSRVVAIVGQQKKRAENYDFDVVDERQQRGKLCHFE